MHEELIFPKGKHNSFKTVLHHNQETKHKQYIAVYIFNEDKI